MAGMIGITNTAEVALVAATAKTVLQLVAATNRRVKVLAWAVMFDGTSVTGEPVQIVLQRQTSAGTSSAGTVSKWNVADDETLQTASRITFTGEPTKGASLEVFEVHPQQGIVMQYPMGQELHIVGGNRLGIECTAPANVNCRAWFRFEE